ncbi:MAG: IS4 family transposase [Deltaproteobacteria bacterium]|jgi:hypothetical protein|nr:IS4 family transposase [Deltaproteobacteria bacterium]
MAGHGKFPPGSVDLGHLVLAGFLHEACPREVVDDVLAKLDKRGKRSRLLPAWFMVYFIIALALWRDRPQEEVLRTLRECFALIFPDRRAPVSPTKSAIFRARLRLGPDVMREAAKRVMKPPVFPDAPGARYKGLRLMSLGGASFDVPDSKENAARFGCPGSNRGGAASPRLRLLGLVENGSRAMGAGEVGPGDPGERELASLMIDDGAFSPEMLILADENFHGPDLWKKADDSGAKLLWRVGSDLVLPVEKRLPDNSFLSSVHDGGEGAKRVPSKVRVIDRELKGENNPNADNVHGTITNMLDYESFPAGELAALCRERLEPEALFAELKIVSKGSGAVIRSKVPDLVFQDIWGLIMIHHAARRMMAREAGKVPGESGFARAVRVTRRESPRVAAFSPGGEKADD